MNAFVTQATKANNAINSGIHASALMNSNAVPAMPPQSSDPVDKLAKEWQRMKELEAEARECRCKIEQEIIELVGVQEEGITNHETPLFKIKTVGKLTRSLDDKAIQADWDNLPIEIKKCVKWKPSLDTKNLRALESMRVDLVPVMAKYMTTKPAKPSISIEEK